MTAASYPVIRCDGPDCGAEAGHVMATTSTEVRLWTDWHQRPRGRDICPDCWKAGHR
ncbi:hypothetical protein [Streptomyces goshikiensis]|uniref:hypothetical protein n=1 Tax=Streptomyces goshikiensis TaxID=1942 RepID=UPI00368CDF73